MHGVLLTQIDLPVAHGRGARAKPIVLRSHAVPRRVALGTETVGFLQSAFYGLRKIECPSSAVALLTGMIALEIPLTAHEGYRRSGGKRRMLPSPRRTRPRSRRTPSRPCKRAVADARGRSSEPLRCRHNHRSMGVR